MLRLRRTWLVKWLGTFLCLLMTIAFVISTRRAISWDSDSLRHEAGLALGSASWGWRPSGWALEAEKYPPRPGWIIAEYGGKPPVSWWIQRMGNTSWEWLSVPLWMPFLVTLVPTGLLWYVDRRATARAVRRFLDWMRPEQLQRVTLLLVLAFTVLHAVGAILAVIMANKAWYFFYPPRGTTTGSGIETLAKIAVPCLVWSAPVWGIIWAWCLVRLRNHLLFRDGLYCPRCGYNLTGNISGICPECGTRMASDPSK